jgi:hypothetical protein
MYTHMLNIFECTFFSITHYFLNSFCLCYPVAPSKEIDLHLMDPTYWFMYSYFYFMGESEPSFLNIVFCVVLCSVLLCSVVWCCVLCCVVLCCCFLCCGVVFCVVLCCVVLCCCVLHKHLGFCEIVVLL